MTSKHNTFVCSFCSDHFPFQTRLDFHELYNCQKNKTFATCPFCYARRRTKKEIEEHYIEFHLSSTSNDDLKNTRRMFTEISHQNFKKIRNTHVQRMKESDENNERIKYETLEHPNIKEEPRFFDEDYEHKMHSISEDCKHPVVPYEPNEHSTANFKHSEHKKQFKNEHSAITEDYEHPVVPQKPKKHFTIKFQYYNPHRTGEHVAAKTTNKLLKSRQSIEDIFCCLICQDEFLNFTKVYKHFKTMHPQIKSHPKFFIKFK